jgi:prevent-host-death family protein
MHITNISDAKASLSQLIKKVQENDESIIIGKAGKPVAIISKYKEDSSPRKLGGSWEGKVFFTGDLDQCDDDITDSFYDSSIFPDK